MPADSLEKTQIKAHETIVQDKYVMQGAAANIVGLFSPLIFYLIRQVRATESLLSLTASLRSAVLLNDFPNTNKQLQSRRLQLERESQVCDDQLSEMKGELGQLLDTMEGALYHNQD